MPNYPQLQTSNLDILPEKEALLYKHVATIHKTNSLSLLQNKITNILYFNAYKGMKTQDVHSITIRDLCKQLGYRGHNYAEIKKAFYDLMTTVVEWNKLKDEKLSEENWTASTILASVRMVTGAVCEYSYSYHMRELLSDPVIYGVINMTYQANFRSKYGLALYENCARFVKIKQTPWFDISFFRLLMGVNENKYLQFRDFKRRVLDTAVDEVNTYSDLYVEPSLFRMGRQVTKIKFSITTRPKKSKITLSLKENTDQQISIDASMGEGFNPRQLEVMDELKRTFNFSQAQVDQCVKRYPVEYISEKINMIKGKGETIHSPVAYLLSALKNDYRDPKPVNQLLKEDIDLLKSEHFQIKAEMFKEKIFCGEIKPEKREEFLFRFEQYLNVSNPEILSIFKREGLNNIRTLQLFYQFYLTKCPDFFGEMP